MKENCASICLKERWNKYFTNWPTLVAMLYFCNISCKSCSLPSHQIPTNYSSYPSHSQWINPFGKRPSFHSCLCFFSSMCCIKYHETLSPLLYHCVLLHPLLWITWISLTPQTLVYKAMLTSTRCPNQWVGDYMWSPRYEFPACVISSTLKVCIIFILINLCSSTSAPWVEGCV